MQSSTRCNTVVATPSIRSPLQHDLKRTETVNFPDWQKVPPTTDKSLRFQQQLRIDATSNERAWLRVSDVVEHVALWLDDRYLGEPETPFQPRVLELPSGTTDAILSVEFVQLHDIRLPHIELVTTGPIRIARHNVRCSEANNSRGSLDVHVELDTNVATSAWIRTVITDQNNVTVVDDARRHSLAHGKNRLRWTESLDQPQLWKRNDAALYNVTTSVGVYGETDVSDSCETTTGFRTIVRVRNALNINDLTIDLGAITPVTSMNTPDFYDNADAHGMCICQQLPADPDHARQVIDLLSNRPSIVAWSRPRRSFLRADPIRRLAARIDNTRPFLTH
jgi:hypothetical protein